MIIIFGFVILLTFVILFYLSNQGKIPKNIPLIFIVLILISGPFLYLARSEESVESFSSLQQTPDIFYTNLPIPDKVGPCEEDCPGMCDLKKKDYDKQLIPNLELIEKPSSSVIQERHLLPVSVSVYAASGYQGNGFKVSLLAVEKNRTKNISYNDTSLYFVSMTMDQLLEFAQNPRKSTIMDNVITLPSYSSNIAKKLIETIDLVASDSFIIMGTCGNEIGGFLESSPAELALLDDKYQLKLLNQLQEGDSFAAIIYKKDNLKYTDISQELSPKTSSTGAFLADVSLIKKGISMEILLQGKQYDDEVVTDIHKYNNVPFVKFEFVYIKPFISSNDFSLVISAENNQTVVYLSERPESATYTLYSESPERFDRKSKTILNTKEPQKWTIDPVYNSEYNDQFYIRTTNNPVYYLEVDTSKGQPFLKASLYKSGASQYFRIEPFKEERGTYTIMNEKTNLYLGYNRSGGYLYKNNGSVMLVESNKYNWRLIPGTSKVKSNWTPARPYNQFKYMDFTSPYDYPNTKQPRFPLSGRIDGKRIDLSTAGRSPWNKAYTPIWNGKWIYYGTIATYGQNLSMAQTKFLEIELNDNGEGTINDTYMGMVIPVRNAGSNYLFGYIDKGIFRGYVATFEFLPLPLEYNGPQNPYPVRMRYLVTNNQNNVLNLSSGNPENLNAYSVKFDGKVPAITSFLEMSGVATYIDQHKGIGFPNK